MRAFPVVMLGMFALTLFCSAMLLFMVQPLVGKMILPLLGGTPEVWNTCMVFFQAILLGGYAYAHVTTKYLGIRKQAGIHLVVLLIPFLFLPISVNSSLIKGGVNPVPAVLLVLLFSVGVPFFVVSTSAPLLQRWFSRTDHPSAKDPYFLYGASNLGSMLALLGYPVAVEPLLKLGYQTSIWAIGYGILVALIAACAWCMWKSTLVVDTIPEPVLDLPPAAPQAATPPIHAEAVRSGKPESRPARSARGRKQERRHTGPARSTVGPSSSAITARQTGITPAPESSPTQSGMTTAVTLGRRIRWVLLAAVPSSLMLGATTYITTDIAAIPLLWVLPLALYLLTFIIVFAKISKLTQSIVVCMEALVVFLLGMNRVYPLVENGSQFMLSVFWIIAFGLFAGCGLILLLRDDSLNHKAMILALPLLVLLVIFMMLSEIKPPSIVDTVALHLLTLFVVAMVCHGELARDRPAAAHLTEFFLLMSVGGVVGGLFNALVAPLIFNSLAEYQVAMVVACLLLPPLTADKSSKLNLIIDASLAGVFVVSGVVLILMRIREPRPGYALDFGVVLQRGDSYMLAVGLLLGLLGGGWMILRERQERLARVLDVAMPVGLLVLMVGLIFGAYSERVYSGVNGVVVNYKITDSTIDYLREADVPESLLSRLGAMKNRSMSYKSFTNELPYYWTSSEREKYEPLLVDMCRKGWLPMSDDRLRLVLMYGLPAILCYTAVERSLRFGLGVGAILLAAVFCNQFEEQVLLQTRSFFGVLVVENKGGFHRLVHGTTLHGQQFNLGTERDAARKAEEALLPLTAMPGMGFGLNALPLAIHAAAEAEAKYYDDALRTPLTYYHRTGPIGQIMASYNDPKNANELPRVGLIGLGTGTMSCYAKKGQHFTFYDIDPKVVKIAQNPDYFTYWSDAVARGANMNLIINDARLAIERQVAEYPDRPEDEKYKVMVIDAFSSDAIPIHLITREALRIYLKVLRQDGMLAFHISNRYLDLAPVLANLAWEEGLVVYSNSDGSDNLPGKTSSTWVVLARDEASLARLWTARSWEPHKKDMQKALAPLLGVPDNGTGLHNLTMALYGATEAIETPWKKLSWYKLTDQALAAASADGVPASVLDNVKDLRNKAYERDDMVPRLTRRLSAKELGQYQDVLLRHAGKWRPNNPLPQPDVGVWTDDYSNLLSVFNWR